MMIIVVIFTASDGSASEPSKHRWPAIMVSVPNRSNSGTPASPAETRTSQCRGRGLATWRFGCSGSAAWGSCSTAAMTVVAVSVAVAHPWLSFSDSKGAAAEEGEVGAFCQSVQREVTLLHPVLPDSEQTARAEHGGTQQGG